MRLAMPTAGPLQTVRLGEEHPPDTSLEPDPGVGPPPSASS